MNRYFYVPVTSTLVTHEGTTLADHLKIVDSELFYRGGVGDYIVTDAEQFKYLIDTDELYHEKLLPSRIVVVSTDDNLFYELVSGEIIHVDSISSILHFEVSGMDVVDIFVDNPNYKRETLNFFRSYTSKINKKDDDIEKGEDTNGERKIIYKLLKIFNRK